MSKIQLPEHQQQWAIALKVPNTGIPELDAMIRESRRMDYAGQAMEGFLVSDTLGEQACLNPKKCAAWSVELADAMLAALDQQPQQSDVAWQHTPSQLDAANGQQPLTPYEKRRNRLHEIAAQLKRDGMMCNCDLDNWEPEPSTGHSYICRIHNAALAAHQKARR